jgi:hypothetical protein
MRRTRSLTWVATLLVLSVAGCGGSPSSNTTGAQPAALVGSVSPDSLNFGNIVVGTTAAPEKVIYQNIGAGELGITAVSTSGDYTQSNNCGNSLPPGAACNIDVSFAPSRLGMRNGSLQITGVSPQNVPLSGMGVNLHNVVLSWGPSTSTVIGYMVFRSKQRDGPFLPLVNVPLPALTFADRVPGGQSWYYYVTAVDANLNESVPSNTATAAVPP